MSLKLFLQVFYLSSSWVNFQSTSTNSLVVRWSRSSSSDCISGYVINVEEDSPARKSQQRFVDANADKIFLTSLSPCRQYVITMQAYLGRSAADGSPIYVGKSSEPLLAQTSPDMTLGPFSLTSLQVRRGKTSITAYWKRQEWPCLFPASHGVIDNNTDADENDTDADTKPKVRVDICRENVASSCFRPTGRIIDVSERLAVTFQGLQPCTDYFVSSYFQHGQR